MYKERCAYCRLVDTYIITCGYVWICVDICGYMWIYVDTCGYMWMYDSHMWIHYVDICGFCGCKRLIWIPCIIYAYSWGSPHTSRQAGLVKILLEGPRCKLFVGAILGCCAVYLNYITLW